VTRRQSGTFLEHARTTKLARGRRAERTCAARILGRVWAGLPSARPNLFTCGGPCGTPSAR
jgi:hypothetical protein